MNCQIAQPRTANQKAPSALFSIQSAPYKPDCKSPKDREEADLCAQGRMAEAAERLTTLTIGQVVIGGLGLGALIGTILLSIKATNAAVRAAKAAEDALGAERAWMTLENVQTTPFRDGTIDDVQVRQGLLMQAQWKNTGRSPALAAEVYTNFRMADLDGPIPIFEAAFPEDEQKSMPIGPGKPVSSVPKALNEEQFLALIGRTQRVFLYSLIRYRDTFTSKLRCTEICVEIAFNGNAWNPVEGSNGPNVLLRTKRPPKHSRLAQ